VNNIINTVLDNLEKIEFGFFDYTTLTINILLLFLVHKVVIKLDPLGEELKDYKAKVKVIRLVSFLFLSTFLVFASLGKNIGANWSQSYILILSLYLINHWLNNFMMMKYGEKSKVDDIERYTDNYVSKMLKVATSSTTAIILFFTLIHIWEKENWLESGSAFVTLGIVLFATKDFWLEEVMSSFVIHAKGNLNRGSVIQLEDESLYVILETKFIGTRVRNLKTKIETIVPNKIFVQNITKVLTIEKEKQTEKKNTDWKPVKQSIIFNIGYNTDYDTVSDYFEEVVNNSRKECSAIGTYEVNIENNGDYAVSWELLYYVNTPFSIKKAKDTLNLNAFKLQKEHNVDLSTPILHSKTL